MDILFYKETRIAPNTFVEDIDIYLTQHTGSKYVDVTIPKELQSGSPSFSVRLKSTDPEELKKSTYAEIVPQNDELAAFSTAFYCFVAGVKYISEQVYEVYFSIDYVNTYQDYLLETSNFKNVTINRRHKDRFDENGLRIYDKFDEELGDVATLKETHETIDTDPHTSCIRFEQPQAFDKESMPANPSAYAYRCGTSELIPYYYPDTDIQLSVKKWYRNLTPTVPMIVYAEDDTPLVLKLDNGSRVFCQVAVLYWKSSTENMILMATKLGDGTFQTISQDLNASWYNTSRVEVNFMTTKGVCYASHNSAPLMIPSVGSIFTVADVLGVDATKNAPYQESSVLQAYSYAKINSADSNIKKVVELPFYKGQADAYEILCDFGGRIAIRHDSDYIANTVTYTYDKAIDISKKGTVMQRDKTYESKLYGSYVRDHFISYDSDTYAVQPEYSKNNTTTSRKMIINTYIPIDLTDGVAINVNGFQSHELYDDWIISKRNNTPTVLTNSQLEYVRTGYNYDTKLRSMQSKQAWHSAGLSMASQVISGATGIVGSALLKRTTSRGTTEAADSMLSGMIVKQAGINAVTSAINLLPSVASTVYNTIASEQNANAALKQKRLQAQNKASSVIQSSDLTTFHLYSGNAIYYNVFGPTEEVERAIWDKFYFTGYADVTHYDVMPTYKTREYFNYLQADISYMVPDSIIADQNVYAQLKSAFASGITFCWLYNGKWLISNYDLYENWEYTEEDTEDTEGE